jgi:GrpB-like predicted nucleotidyltransferase (UPF0157 family)
MDEVEIVDYDPRWPLLFVEEARRLRAVLDPSQIMGLEHFGSTAIPGLSAKPIIDILITVRSLAVAQATVVDALRNLDYVYWADNPKGCRHLAQSAPIMCTSQNHMERCGSGWRSGIICALIQMRPGLTSGSKDDSPPNIGQIARLIPRLNLPMSKV